MGHVLWQIPAGVTDTVCLRHHILELRSCLAMARRLLVVLDDIAGLISEVWQQRNFTWDIVMVLLKLFDLFFVFVLVVLFLFFQLLIIFGRSRNNLLLTASLPSNTLRPLSIRPLLWNLINYRIKILLILFCLPLPQKILANMDLKDMQQLLTSAIEKLWSQAGCVGLVEQQPLCVLADKVVEVEREEGTDRRLAPLLGYLLLSEVSGHHKPWPYRLNDQLFLPRFELRDHLPYLWLPVESSPVNYL